MKVTLTKITAMALVAAASAASSEEIMAQPSLRAPLPQVEASSAVSSDEKASEGFPDDALFPEEMNKEDRRSRDFSSDSFDDRRNRNFSSESFSDDNGSRPKKNSAQKRQSQRDDRRYRENPNRSQGEEQRERNRKNSQAANRGNRCTDPSEPGCGNDNYPRNREAQRRYRCETRDEGCNHERVNPDREPNRRRSAEDRDCVEWCNDEYPSDTSASEDFNRNRRSNNDNNSRAKSCANRRCDAETGAWKNGAKTFGEWLVTQE